MYKIKTDSPKNALQIYIDGIRYRSLFSASIDTGISFRLLCQKMKKSSGEPVMIRGLEVMSENWILYGNPKKLIECEEINMSDTNNIIAEGRITRNAELKTAGQTTVTTFSIANNQPYKKDGNWIDNAYFFDCEIWGEYGAKMLQYLVKGQKLTVEGILTQQTWKDKEEKTHSTVKIRVEKLSIQFSPKNQQNAQAQVTQYTEQQQVDENGEPIPF